MPKKSTKSLLHKTSHILFGIFLFSAVITGVSGHEALIIESIYDFEAMNKEHNNEADSGILDEETSDNGATSLSGINLLQSEETPAISEDSVQTVTIEDNSPEELPELLVDDEVPNYDPVFIPLPSDNATIDTYKKIAIEADQSNIWLRIIDGFRIPTVQSPIVNTYEKNYVKNAELFTTMVHRSERYLYHILQEVDRRDMPTEIALLPIIESAYKPYAVSSSKAVGIWQIIPSTGSHFGLTQNWWVDERRNIMDATNVALDYLSALHRRFGSWDLALAAYNAGEGTVSRAIKKNKALGKSTHYRHLILPKETRKYVPKLQAVKNIVMNPERYGIDIKPIKDQPYFTAVNAPKQIDTMLVAQLAEISHEEFTALNPSHKRPIIASTSDENTLLLPIFSADIFQYNLSVYDKPLVSWQPYTMQRGETLSSVAKMFAMDTKELARINQLATYTKSKGETTVLVPNHKTRALAANAQVTDVIQTAYIDIDEIQQSQNIAPFFLKKLQSNHNKIKQKRLAKKRGISHRKNRIYTVKKGDTLSEISEKYDVSVKYIVALNNIKKKRIKVGQKLRLSGNSKKRMTRKK